MVMIVREVGTRRPTAVVKVWELTFDPILLQAAASAITIFQTVFVEQILPVLYNASVCEMVAKATLEFYAILHSVPLPEQTVVVPFIL